MIEKDKIITFCGSTRFKEDILDKLRKIIEDYLKEYWSKKWEVLMDGGRLLFVYDIYENFKLFYDDEIQNWCLDSMRHEIPLDILSEIYKILVNNKDKWHDI